MPIPLALALPAIAGGLGIATNMFQNNQDRKNNLGTMREQMEYQSREARAMAIFNKEQQLDLWKKTNYKAQMDEMREAGLNPGLLYGMGGGGGATASLASSSMTAPSGGNQKSTPIDIASIMGMKQQLELQRAQTENVKAQTEKTKVEAEKIGGVDTEATKASAKEAEARTENLLQDVLEKRVSQQDRMNYIASEARKAIAEVRQQEAQATITEETAQAQIETIKTNAIGATLGNVLLRKDAKLKDEQMREIDVKIQKMAADVQQGWQQLKVEQQRAKIQQFAEEIKANYPSIVQSAGKMLDDGVKQLYRIFEELGLPQEAPQHKVK